MAQAVTLILFRVFLLVILPIASCLAGNPDGHNFEADDERIATYDIDSTQEPLNDIFEHAGIINEQPNFNFDHKLKRILNKGFEKISYTFRTVLVFNKNIYKATSFINITLLFRKLRL